MRRCHSLIELALCLVPFGIFMCLALSPSLRRGIVTTFWRLYLLPTRNRCPYTLAGAKPPCGGTGTPGHKECESCAGSCHSTPPFATHDRPAMPTGFVHV